MGRHWLKLVAVCLIISTLPTFSGNSWSMTDASQWTLEDVQKILWESPWVKRKPYFFYIAPRSRVEVAYYVRIQSASTIRLALAKFTQFQPERNIRVVGPINPEETSRRAEEMRFPDELVIAVLGLPAPQHQDFNRYTLRLLKPYTSIQVGQAKEVPLRGFIAPQDADYGEALFRFPRPILNERSSSLRFKTALWIPHRVELEVKFDIDEWRTGNEIIY